MRAVKGICGRRAGRLKGDNALEPGRHGAYVERAFLTRNKCIPATGQRHDCEADADDPESKVVHMALHSVMS